MNLFARLIESDRSGSLLSSSAGSLEQKDLLALEAAFGGLLQAAQGQKVALAFLDPALMAKALLLLDGLCTQILLLPGEVDPGTSLKLMDQADTTFLITDHSGDQAYPGTVRPFIPEAGRPPERNQATRWILPTSGTTATPKLISHTLESLIRSVKPATPVQRPLVWGMLYQLNRFAGLQVFFQALLGGGSLVLPDSCDLPLTEQLQLFVDRGVDSLSATPTLWRKLLMTGISLPLRQITLGGEIVPQGIIDSLAARFPQAKISQVYASTEVGVGFSVADRREGFPAEWLEDPAFRCSIERDSSRSDS
jgi:acyl-CoA synthetase (AMP-forming)/AMP-acid ligase II